MSWQRNQCNWHWNYHMVSANVVSFSLDLFPKIYFSHVTSRLGTFFDLKDFWSILFLLLCWRRWAVGSILDLWSHLNALWLVKSLPSWGCCISSLSCKYFFWPQTFCASRGTKYCNCPFKGANVGFVTCCFQLPRLSILSCKFFILLTAPTKNKLRHHDL